MTWLETIGLLLSAVIALLGWAKIKHLQRRLRKAEAKSAKEALDEMREETREEVSHLSLRELVDLSNERTRRRYRNRPGKE